jgi:hypothetical protein
MFQVALGVSRGDDLFPNAFKDGTLPNDDRACSPCIGLRGSVQDTNLQFKSNRIKRCGKKMLVGVVTRPRPGAWWRLSPFHPVSTSPGCRHTAAGGLLRMYGNQDLHDSILVIPHAHMSRWWWCGMWVWMIPLVLPGFVLLFLAAKIVLQDGFWVALWITVIAVWSWVRLVCFTLNSAIVVVIQSRCYAVPSRPLWETAA